MICSFCNNHVPKGTGFIYVIKDGTVFSFCSQKCKRNLISLKRERRLLKWTSKVAVLRREKVEKKKTEFAAEIEKKLEEKYAKKEGKEEAKGKTPEKKEKKEAKPPEKPKEKKEEEKPSEKGK